MDPAYLLSLPPSIFLAANRLDVVAGTALTAGGAFREQFPRAARGALHAEGVIWFASLNGG